MNSSQYTSYCPTMHVSALGKFPDDGLTVEEKAKASALFEIERIRSSLKKAKALTSPTDRDKALIEFTKTKLLDSPLQIEAANAISDLGLKEKTLVALALNEDLDTLERIDATAAISDSTKRDQVWIELTSSRQLSESQQIEAATNITNQQKRDYALMTFAEKEDLESSYRIQAAEAITPLDQKETTLCTLVKEAKITDYERLNILKAITNSALRESTLRAIASDERHSPMHRVDVAKMLDADTADAIIESILLCSLESKDGYPVIIAQSINDATKRNKHLKALAQNKKISDYSRMSAANAITDKAMQMEVVQALILDKTLHWVYRKYFIKNHISDQSLRDNYCIAMMTEFKNDTCSALDVYCSLSDLISSSRLNELNAIYGVSDDESDCDE